LRDGIAVLAVSASGGEIIHACQDETGPHFGIAGDGPDTERCGELLKCYNQLIFRWTMPFEDVAEQDHKVGPLRLYLGYTSRQPTLAELRTEVHIGQGDEHCPVHSIGKAGKAHLVFLYHRRPQALEERDHRKHYTD
jgi:hypothetical protein